VTTAGGIPFELVHMIGGVRELVGTSAGPICLTDGLVALIRDREANGDFDVTRRVGKKNKIVVPKGLDIGDDVEITDGPFKGFMAQIAEFMSNERIKVSVQILGGDVPSMLDIAQIK
jgi:transcription antitermination factor NusG